MVNVLHRVLCHTDVYVGSHTSPHILNFGITWRWVISNSVHCIGHWTHPRDSPVAMYIRKMSCPCLVFEPWFTIQLIAQPMYLGSSGTWVFNISKHYLMFFWPCIIVQTFQNTNLVHNSFNLQQYICYTTLLNMFRAACCSKHVEECSVTYVLLKIKRIEH